VKIYANTIVRNDERWIWYAVSSIVDYVEKILIWDTGSTDNTLDIIRKLKEEYPEKIFIKEVERADPHEFSLFRQEMLDASDCDWIIVLDSDEIWWDKSISKIIKTINEGNVDVIVTPFINLVGDIYHFQEEKAGRYNIDGKVGNITVKVFRKNISGLKVSNNYGSEGYVDGSGKFLQKSVAVKRKFIEAPFLHTTHLVRSEKDFETMGRKGKVKHEIGKSFSKDFYYPEALFRDRAEVVPSPWNVMTKEFRFKAFFETPLRKIKRKIWKGKVGY